MVGTQLTGQLDRDFLNWFSGFWEGEGYLTIHKSRWTGVELGIKQKSRTPLELIRSKLGGHICFEKNHNKRKGKTYSIWKWYVSRRWLVIKIMQLILPYLRFRKRQVNEKLEFLKKLENARPTDKLRRMNFSEEEIAFLKSNWRKPDGEIAKALGRTINSVSHKRRRLGLLKSGGKGRRGNRYDWEALKEDYKKGMSTTELQDKYGCNSKTAWNALKRMGVPIRSRVEAVRLHFAKLNEVEK